MTLEEARAALAEGRRLAMQTSLGRRVPAAEAHPLLGRAQAALRAHVGEHAEDGEAWRLLSEAEECTLHYRAAREALERALTLGPPGERRRDLKRLAHLRACEAWWARLGLYPSQLRDLGLHLERALDRQKCAHDVAHTRGWLASEGIAGEARIFAALAEAGGRCDCEVLANVVRG